jgi:hypothetical protein
MKNFIKNLEDSIISFRKILCVTFLCEKWEEQCNLSLGGTIRNVTPKFVWPIQL